MVNYKSGVAFFYVLWFNDGVGTGTDCKIWCIYKWLFVLSYSMDNRNVSTKL